MARSASDVARFLRAAVKTGLRMQRSQAPGAGENGSVVAQLQRIKAAVQKSQRPMDKQS